VFLKMDSTFSIPWSRIFFVVTDIHFFALMAKRGYKIIQILALGFIFCEDAPIGVNQKINKIQHERLKLFET
jgi:hypothetical protein